MRVEIRIGGFGGQGIIRSGLILAAASCVYGDKNAIQTASYGPESRGGRCKSEVIISDEDIDFPKVEHPDTLVAMSQEAYLEYVNDLKEDGTLIVDSDLVPNQRKNLKAKIYEVPATRIAEELGKKIVANVVMIGAVAAITDLFDVEQLKESVRRNVPKAFVELNLTAFEKGYEHGKSLLKKA
jgi:2-oxoglutarate ferredoxin oxidoreductase subunit gamma